MAISRRAFLGTLPLALAAGRARARGAAPRTRNVLLVTTDGLRWQEVFRGAEAALLNKPDGGVEDVEAIKSAFWRETPEERRAVLLPFIWGVIAKEGQLYGDLDAGSSVRVSNGLNFSYPGYNELLTGAPDARIDSNDKNPNPNVTVLEWLNGKPEYHGKVAAFGSWDVFPYIINEKRSGVPVTAGWEPIGGDGLTERQAMLNELITTSHQVWEGSCLDSFTLAGALEHARVNQPRVLYVALGETDEFAHEGRYDYYLRSAQRFDNGLRRLWSLLQGMPAYRGQTSLVITTDHGRGDPPKDWRSHGAKVQGSENMWVGVLGPDTPARGPRRDVAPVTQAQVAATVAALLGEDYCAAFPKVAPPIADAIAG